VTIFNFRIIVVSIICNYVRATCSIMINIIFISCENFLADSRNDNLCNMNLAHISSYLIFIITITTLTGEKLNNSCNLKDTSLPYYVIPVHYHIELTHMNMEANDLYWSKILNLENKNDIFNFYGESNITINILQSTQYIKFHKLNLIIIPWKITMIKNNGIIYKLEKSLQTSETYLLESQFLSVLSPGLYTLKLEFVGHFTEDSLKNVFKTFYIKRKHHFA